MGVCDVDVWVVYLPDVDLSEGGVGDLCMVGQYIYLMSTSVRVELLACVWRGCTGGYGGWLGGLFT